MRTQPKFSGATYSEPLDKERLSTALTRVERALATRHWFTLAELAKIARCSEAGASARIRDLRRSEHGAHIIIKRRRGDPKRGLWEYFLEGQAGAPDLWWPERQRQPRSVRQPHPRLSKVHMNQQTDVSQMAAGRELDALVAKQVMGLVWDDKRCRVCGWPLAPHPQGHCEPGNCSMRYPDEAPPDADTPRPYSTDIAAAWEVVEKLRRDWRFLFQETPGRRWRAGFSSHRVSDRAFMHVADTAPLAICLAALKAGSR